MTNKHTSQVDQDLELRAIKGSYTYVLIWLVIAGWLGFYESNPAAFLIWSVALFLMGVSRSALAHFSNRMRPGFRDLWLYIFAFNAVAPALSYGVLLSLTMLNAGYQPLFEYLLMAVFALVSGGVINFAPHKAILLAFLAALIVPPTITSLFFAESRQLVGILLMIYSAFMFVQTNRLNREYFQMIDQQEQLEKLNNEDVLTGIANRRYFEAALRKSWKVHMRAESRIGLLIIDIDHFKNVNDTHGHPTGDAVIKSVAQCIAQSCQRDTDEVARIGGEEFAVLVGFASEKSIKGLSEKIRSRVAALEVPFEEKHLQVTVSIGANLIAPKPKIDIDDLFRIADQHLYVAKENGRNQVVTGFN